MANTILEELKEKANGAADNANNITDALKAMANGAANNANNIAEALNALPLGSSSWTKIAEAEYEVSTANTSPDVAATLDTGHPEIWTADKILYVRIRDKAGKRSGYFYGTDLFFCNVDAKNENAESSVTIASWNVIMWASSTGFSYRVAQFGVFPWMLHNDGKIDIGARYNASNSGTIDGTYLVEVYLLDPAAPIFE